MGIWRVRGESQHELVHGSVGERRATNEAGGEGGAMGTRSGCGIEGDCAGVDGPLVGAQGDAARRPGGAEEQYEEGIMD
jgi:hypothetical protein